MTTERRPSVPGAVLALSLLALGVSGVAVVFHDLDRPFEAAAPAPLAVQAATPVATVAVRAASPVAPVAVRAAPPAVGLVAAAPPVRRVVVVRRTRAS